MLQPSSGWLLLRASELLPSSGRIHAGLAPRRLCTRPVLVGSSLWRAPPLSSDRSARTRARSADCTTSIGRRELHQPREARPREMCWSRRPRAQPHHAGAARRVPTSPPALGRPLAAYLRRRRKKSANDSGAYPKGKSVHFIQNGLVDFMVDLRSTGGAAPW